MTNLHTLNARGLLDSSQVHLLEADYRDATTYETRGISLHETGLIFNYPMATTIIWRGSWRTTVDMTRSCVYSRTTAPSSSTSWRGGRPTT